MRVVISKIQENLINGNIQNVDHVRSQLQLGDVFTKNRACPDKLLKVLESGKIEKEK